MRDVTVSRKTKKQENGSGNGNGKEKRKGNLSFLSLHKTLSFLAWAVNIFRFRLRTVSDCESVAVTVTFAVTLCGISNDFFLKSRGKEGERRRREAVGGSALRRASRSLLNVYALLNLISLPHSLARLPALPAASNDSRG